MLNQFYQSQNISFSEIAVSIESPHQRIVDFPLTRGVSVYPAKSNAVRRSRPLSFACLRLNVNQKTVYDYHKSRFPSGSKSDTADAQSLADYLREHHAHLSLISKTAEDVTKEFLEGVRKTVKIARRNGVKLAILKARSPSCGVNRIYDGAFSGKLIKGDGVTAALLRKEGIELISDEEIN